MNKQIEEMADILCKAKEHNCNGGDDCLCIKQGTALYNTGYRNEKETAKEILSWVERIAKPTYYNVDDNPRKEDYILLSDIYKFFKEKFGVEVK